MRILLALLALSTVLTAAPQISESKAISTFKKGFRGTRAKPPSVEQRRAALVALNAVAHRRPAALAGALATIGEEEHAAQLMSAFKWGPAFLALNFGTEVL